MQQIKIKLSTLSKPRDICRVMEAHGVKYYTYTFETADGTVIKHGKAADNEWMSGTWGDRIYRQASGIDGWKEYELSNSAANKMRHLMSDHFPDTDRYDVTITVYDYTVELTGQDQKEIDRILLNEEDALVQAHIAEHGESPKLNIQKTKTRTVPYLPTTLWDSN